RPPAGAPRENRRLAAGGAPRPAAAAGLLRTKAGGSEVDEWELNPLITLTSSRRSPNDTGPGAAGRGSCYRLRPLSVVQAPSIGRPNPKPATGVKAVARIAGVNIPTNKRVIIALQYIHGIGAHKANEIMEKVNIPQERRVSQLTDQEVLSIREVIDRDY